MEVRAVGGNRESIGFQANVGRRALPEITNELMGEPPKLPVISSSKPLLVIATEPAGKANLQRKDTHAVIG